MRVEGVLGIDAGTQGLSVTLADAEMRVVATGEAGYGMVDGLGEGCYEQRPGDWEEALRDALEDLRGKMAKRDPDWRVRAIGLSGQMHGEVLVGDDGAALAPARLWCDARNETEGAELTDLFGVKIPKRVTAARWLWTLRNRPDLAARTRRLTTPGGWLAYRLTGEWRLGVGDASGMFPIDPETGTYSNELLRCFDETAPAAPVRLGGLLPVPAPAGGEGGVLRAGVATALGLEPGIPVAPAEGDQPAALAGSLMAEAGQVAMSFGTSVCANAVGDRPFQGVHPGIDHFCAADGKPINMVWLRNGTTFLNRVVDWFAGPSGSRDEAFRYVLPALLAAPADCGGVLALPFLDDEPGLGVPRGGLAAFVGLSAENATPGNLAKAALLATMFNLKLGVEELDRQGYPRHEIVLSGGLTRTPELGRLLADVFDTPVALLESASEGSAWGAALLAGFRRAVIDGESAAWGGYLRRYAAGARRFTPEPGEVRALAGTFARYRAFLALRAPLDQALRSPS